MGLFGDIEHGLERGFDGAVHAGESAMVELDLMLGKLRAVIAGAGLGAVVKELEQLADEANALRGRLARAVAETRWTGSAATAFAQRAHQRDARLGGLVRAIDGAHGAVAAAYAVAGIG
jgi:uncharacterized protein YukE